MISTFRFALAILFVVASAAALGDQRVLAGIAGGSAITVDDLMAEVARLPQRAQAQALARPTDVQQLAQSMLLRRELARQAEAAGLQNDPKVAEALRAARERILADAALAHADGAPPDAATLERLARNQYDAAPQKFDTPEEVRVRHILVAARACEPEVRAKELLAKAKQPGADFAALAQANSDDPGSAARGGDLGFFARGKMTGDFEKAAFALKQPGDLSDVVKTEYGYHVIRLEERKPAGRQPFDAVRDSLVKSLADAETRARRQQAVDKVIAGMQFDGEAIEAVVAKRGPSGRSN